MCSFRMKHVRGKPCLASLALRELGLRFFGMGEFVLFYLGDSRRDVNIMGGVRLLRGFIIFSSFFSLGFGPDIEALTATGCF